MARRIEQKPDELKDIVGLPDEWDIRNLNALINNFKKEYFNVYGRTLTGQQWITYELLDSREANQVDDPSAFNKKDGMKIKSSELRIGSAMPYILWNAIEAAYPMMFRNKEHFNWFLKHYPEFRVAKRF